MPDPVNPELLYYHPIRASRSEFLSVRGLRYHVRFWEPVPGIPSAGTMLMLHGWMDVSASFQFLVDALKGNWRVISPDWRGYGQTDWPGGDCYWFPDYLGDLDALADELFPGEPINLVGHSMGGNVATLFSGIRPHRVRKLVNLEGVGMPATRAEQAPERYARWLDEIRRGSRMRDYACREDVAQRLMQNNPRLGAGQARFLAEHWSRPTADGRFELAGDPTHKVVNANLYNVEEVLACWRQVRADVLLVFAHHAERWQRFISSPAYQRRLLTFRSLVTRTVDDAGHMMHHDQPAKIAQMIEEHFA